MNPVQNSRRLIVDGRFNDALRCLESAPVQREIALDAEVLRAELLERTGRYSESRTLAESLIKTRRLSLAQRSACEFSLGLIDWDEGGTDASITHFQRSLKYASAADDSKRICWAEMRLMVVQAGRLGPVATARTLLAVRRNVMRAAEPSISAALHILIGEMEAKRGLLNSAKRHTELGCNLLALAPNLWLEAVAENNHVAICLMRSELRQGLLHAERARQLAEESGAAAMQRAALANIGNLHFGLGNLLEAIEYFELSRRFLPATGEYSNGATESLARTYLLQADVDRAIDCLNVIEASIQAPDDRALYANRHALLTWADVHVRQGDFRLALERLGLATSLASAAGDDLLGAMARIKRAEILATLRRREEAGQDLDDVARTLLQLPAEVFAHYERAIGRVSALDGSRQDGLRHYIRSERVFSGLHHVPGLLEVTQLRDQSEDDAESQASPPSPSRRSVLEPSRDRLVDAPRRKAGTACHRDRRDPFDDSMRRRSSCPGTARRRHQRHAVVIRHREGERARIGLWRSGLRRIEPSRSCCSRCPTSSPTPRSMPSARCSARSASSKSQGRSGRIG